VRMRILEGQPRPLIYTSFPLSLYTYHFSTLPASGQVQPMAQSATEGSIGSGRVRNVVDKGKFALDKDVEALARGVCEGFLATVSRLCSQ
jgi:hypothetical protein